MRTLLALVLCGAATLMSGCAPGITRTGYQPPAAQTTGDLPRRPIAIQCKVAYDTNEVVVLGSIHAYDTGLSVACDEAAILDIFCREGNMLGADVVDITEEHQPNPFTSTCYRAKATFLRFKDREKARNLVSDAKYAPDLIIERSAKNSKRNQEIITGAVLGGVLGAIVVSVATEPYHPLNHTNSVPENWSRKP